MEYIYGALLLHSAGKEIDEENLKKVLTDAGVSVDSSESHKKFQDKFNLNFTLVSDRQKDIVKKYGVLGLATAKRVTYIIKDGKIVFVYPKVSPREHAKEVYDKIIELKLVE